ncbi:MAG: hypothetical protein ABIF01_01975 [Candidatus Micrarchaeota archaeon]
MKFLRGQVFSYDLVFALMVVAFLLWYSINAANAFAEKISDVEMNNRMSEVAQSAILQLTQSPGNPSNWESLEVKSIGVAESRGVLDRRKIERLAYLSEDMESYDKLRALLSFNRQGGAYLFSLKITEIDGRVAYSVGPEPPPGASVAATSKTMSMDGRLVGVSLRAWDIGEGVGK